MPRPLGSGRLKEKTCTACDRTLPRSAFRERASGSGWIHWLCKECDRTRQMNRYWRRIKLLDAIRLAIGCADCGYAEDAHALDFDHVRGEKTFGVVTGWGRNMTALLDEIEKCEIRCANCHRIKTWSNKTAA